MPANPDEVLTDTADGLTFEADGYGYAVKDSNGVVHQSEPIGGTHDALTNLQRAKLWAKPKREGPTDGR